MQAAVGLGGTVVLPLGLRLLDDARLVPVPRPRSPLWPVAGGLAAVALLLPRGAPAVAVALPFVVASALLLVASVRALAATLLRRPTAGTGATSASVAAAVAPGTLAVGALALVGDRAGWSVLGFEGDILLLTVPHMLFAGFGACLVAGLAAVAERAAASRAASVGTASVGTASVSTPAPGTAPSRLARAGAAGVVGGVLAVLGGYLVSDEAELVGTVVLTAGLWCATAAAWRAARGGTDRTGAGWAALAGVGAVAAMVLALWWAVGQVTDVPHPDLSWMVATHGALNALTVVLASLVGLRVRAMTTARAAQTGGAGSPGAAPAGAGARPRAPHGRGTAEGGAGTWTTQG
ncbi:hypothetical protein GC089_13245 [Cellulomonas sp. JZ18]|nr:hypothetical protein GC089_13245 [Cellulomonas sp. JZ18]